jgi:hypothetical protein
VLLQKHFVILHLLVEFAIPIFKFFVLNTRFRLFCSENNSIFAP